MSNTSYCMFENTLTDLRDCYEALCDGKELSESEEKAKAKLIRLCQDIVADFGEDQ